MGSNDLLVSEEQSLLKSVEQMSKEGDEPPSAYHVVEGLNGFGSNKDSSTQTPIPIIDVSLLSSEDELKKLRSALSSAGLFQVWSIKIYKNFISVYIHDTDAFLLLGFIN